MKIVVDASVVVKWVVDEPESKEAAELLEEELLSPSLWVAEAANALWKLVYRRELTSTQAAQRFAALLIAPVATTPLEADVPKALELSSELRHPVYDCTYLAAALREDALLVTSDHRFHATLAKDRRFAPLVRLLTSTNDSP